MIFRSCKSSNNGLLRDVLEWQEMKKYNTKNARIISEVFANYSEACGYFPIRW